MLSSQRRAIPIARILRFYWRAAWRYPGLVVGCLLATPLTVLVDTILPPLIVSDVLNRLSTGDYQRNQLWTSFSTDLIGYAVVVFLGWIVTWRIVDYFLWRLEGRVQRDLAQRCFGHLIGQSADFHANTFGGALVSQTNKLMGSYIRIADTTVFQLLPLVCVLGAIVAIMAAKAALFAVILALFSVVYVVIAAFVSHPVRRIGAEHAATESGQTGHLADAIANVMAVKSFARERYERQRFAEATERTREALLRLSRVHMRQMAWFGGLTSVISIGAFAVATDGVVSGGAEIGTMFLIVNYTISAVQQLFKFSSSGLRTYNRAFGDAADMIEILERESDVRDPTEPERSRIGPGEIRFQDVTFRHAGSRDTLFDGLNLRIEPGERSAWSATLARARPASPTCCCVSPTWTAGGSCSTGRTSPGSPRPTCAPPSPTCRRNHCCSTGRSARTSPTAGWTPTRSTSSWPPPRPT
jgi:ATP-binding cassette subfamily B protein